MERPKIVHIIVAAGSGTRFGASIPKQFCQMLGRPVLMETVERFRKYGHSGEIILVLHPDWVNPWLDMCQTHDFQSPTIVTGGTTRWESVKNAISQIPDGVDIVTVHDGARPVVRPEIIDAVIEAVAEGAAGAIPTVEVTDSLRMTDPDGGSHSVDRSLFKAVQTPQGFNADMLVEAYRHPYLPTFTDDASVMESSFPGCRMVLTPGHITNIKITNLPDLDQAASYISAESTQK